MNRPMKKMIGILACASAVALVGACSSDSNDTDETTTTAPAATTTVAATTPAASSTPMVAQSQADPRCKPADEQYTLAVANGLNDKSLTLDNAQMIVEGDLVFYGASTVRPDGKFENRSDVWVISKMLPTSSTGGARSTTMWTKTTDTLGISAGDERVQAVDKCVVDASRG